MKTNTEKFISLSGKPYASKAEYLKAKLKREKSKFSLGYKVFESVIKSGVKRQTVEIKTAIDKVVKGESPKVIYLADNLITNRKKGFLGLIVGGENYKIENQVRKIVSKGDKSNGTVDAIVKFDLVKV